SWDCPFVVLGTRMAPGEFPGRLDHRCAPRRELGRRLAADQRVGALPRALHADFVLRRGCDTAPEMERALDSNSRGPDSPRLRWGPCGPILPARSIKSKKSPRGYNLQLW